MRYLGEVNATLATFAANYQLSTKYSFAISETYNIADRRSQNANFTVVRKFDRFFMTFGIYWDQVKDEAGVRFGLFPEGLGYGVSTDQLNTLFGP